MRYGPREFLGIPICRLRCYSLAAMAMERPSPHRYSIVIPVYNNEESLPLLIAAIESIDLEGTFEVVFVIDGSPDASYAYLHGALPTPRFSAQVVRLSRNFGSFSAIRAGMAVATGANIGVMAADLQESPDVVAELFRKLDSGTCDIAIGSRISRTDPLISRVLASLFWRVYRLLILRDIPAGGVDIFACTRAVRDVIVSLDERNTSLVGLLFWIGFSRDVVPYQRRARPFGRSAWTFRRKLRYMSDSVFAFSDIPIRIITAVGVLGVAISLVVSTIVFSFWIAGAIQVPGYTPLILAIFFVGMLLLTSVGIVGAYVFRAYENSKGRPSYIIASREHFEPRS